MIANLMAKFRNTPHRPEELLGVAELVKDLFVLRGLELGNRRCRGTQLNPPSAFESWRVFTFPVER